MEIIDGLKFGAKSYFTNSHFTSISNLSKSNLISTIITYYTEFNVKYHQNLV